METTELDPITANAITFLRKRRRFLGWSAQHLADRCEAFGAIQEPPVPSTVSRSRIAKLETGNGVTIRIDEAWLLAGAFGVSLDVLITNSLVDPETVEADFDPDLVVSRASVLDRVRRLEGQLADLVTVLGNLGINGLPDVGYPEA